MEQWNSGTVEKWKSGKSGNCGRESKRCRFRQGRKTSPFDFELFNREYVLLVARSQESGVRSQDKENRVNKCIK